MSRSPAKRTPLQVMKDTVFALFMREVRTRFNGRLGYFWAIAEPLAQSLIFASMWSLIGRDSLAGVPVALFMIAAITPFKAFMKLMMQIANAVKSNKGVMGYRQVEPIDPVITRFLIELVTFFVVFAILLVGMAWFLDYGVLPKDWLAVLSAFLLLFGFGMAFGLIMCSVVEHWDDGSRLLGMLTMPMMMVSGVFFNMTMVPTQYWYLFQWNPATHALELIRDNYFWGYSSGFGDWGYLIELNAVSWLLALALYQINRRRFKIA